MENVLTSTVVYEEVDNFPVQHVLDVSSNNDCVIMLWMIMLGIIDSSSSSENITTFTVYDISKWRHSS